MRLAERGAEGSARRRTKALELTPTENPIRQCRHDRLFFLRGLMRTPIGSEWVGARVLCAEKPAGLSMLGLPVLLHEQGLKPMAIRLPTLDLEKPISGRGRVRRL